MICFSAIILLVAVLLSGVTVQKLLKLPFSFTNAVMVGFLTLMAVFQVIAYPMMRLNTSFTLLFWTYSLVLLLLVAAGAAVLLRPDGRSALSHHTGSVLHSLRSDYPALILAVLAIAAALTVFGVYSFCDSDDSYYLPRVMEILSQNRLDLPQGFIWSGIPNTSMPENVDASTLELWKAYWSHLFGMHPTIFCKVPLSLVIYFVSWCSAYQAYRSLSHHTGSPGAGCIFLAVYLVLLLMDAWMHDSFPFWIMRHPSHGKSLILSVIYPAILYSCAKVVELKQEPIPWNRWCVMSLVLTAGISVSIIGVFWPFLCCFSFGVSYLLIDRRKDLHKLLGPLVLACMPVVVYAGLSYFSIATRQTRYFDFPCPNWLETLRYVLSENLLDIFLFSLVFVCLCGSRRSKLILVGGTVALFAGILNPLFTPFVSKYLSTGNVYFRLFWMIPIHFVVAFTIAEVFGARSVRCRQLLAGSAAAVVILGSGALMTIVPVSQLPALLGENLRMLRYSEIRTNPYGMSQYWCSMGQAMLDQAEPDGSVRIIWLSEKDCFLRQYSHRIEILGACRDTQRQYFDQPVGDCTVSPLEIAQQFDLCNKADFDEPQWAAHQLTLSGVDFVCVDSSSGFAQRSSVPSGFELFGQFGDYTVYRIVPSGR